MSILVNLKKIVFEQNFNYYRNTKIMKYTLKTIILLNILNLILEPFIYLFSNLIQLIHSIMSVEKKCKYVRFPDLSSNKV